MCAVDFSTMVLMNGSWPFQPSHQITLPPELEAYKEHFTLFYKVISKLIFSNRNDRILRCIMMFSLGFG